MIRDKIFTALAKLATSRKGWIVLVVAALLTAVSLSLLPQLRILTSREGMVSDKIPEQARYVKYNNDFGTPNQLVILLEGQPEQTRQAADRLAEQLIKDPAWVKNVFYKIDMEPLKKAGLYYIPLGDLQTIEKELGQNETTLRSVLESGSWATVLSELENQFGKVSTDSLDDENTLEKSFTGVGRLLDQWAQYLEHPDTAKFTAAEKAFEELAGDQQQQIDTTGHLVGKNGQNYILFVQQAKPVDDTEFTLPFMKYCRESATLVMKDFPGVTAGFTGWPVSIEEEIDLIQTDLQKVTLVSGILIVLLFLSAFRSIHRTVLVFIPLIFGVVWNLALTIFTVGHLNYLTSVFVGILFGLGIDYGVVFVRRYDEERAAGHDTKDAVIQTLRAVGPPISTGAGTTIAAFFAIGFTDQPAFSELGIVAGTGVLCVLLSTVFVLPLLLAKFPPKVDPEKIHQREKSKILFRASTFLLRRPLPLLVIFGAVIAFLATQIPKVGFDYNINNLLPDHAESVRVSERLEQTTEYKIQYITVISDTVAQAQQLDPKLLALDSVRRVESIAMLVPEHQDQKKGILLKLHDRLSAIGVGTPPDAVEIQPVKKALESLIDRVETAQEDAFTSGKKALVTHLDKTLAKLEKIDNLLDSENAQKGQTKFEHALFAELGKAKTEIEKMTQANPITLDTLPRDLRERFQSKSGLFATYVFPTKKIWDIEFLDHFLEQVEGAAKPVLGEDKAYERMSGFGVVYRITSGQIRSGFSTASWMAGIVVLLMLFMDFRKPSHVLLAACPLIFGVIATMGGLGLMGRDLNLASQISFPILLGIGVDYGILMMRRKLEPGGNDLPKVVSTIGSAITLAALTTIAGFGSLLFARHRGLIAFGEVLVVAIFICLFSALAVLPAILKALKMEKTELKKS